MLSLRDFIFGRCLLIPQPLNSSLRNFLSFTSHGSADLAPAFMKLKPHLVTALCISVCLLAET